MKRAAKVLATLSATVLLTTTLVTTPVALGTAEAAGEEAGDETPTTVILVRHAEKTAPTEDPPLSPEGEERARQLAHALSDLTIDAIYTTSFQRTRATARPLAQQTGIDAQVFDPQPAAIAEQIRAHHRGQTVVVVGHSNTVPATMSALGVAGVQEMSEEEYDHLFVVTLPAAGSAAGKAAMLLPLRYGRPTP